MKYTLIAFLLITSAFSCSKSQSMSDKEDDEKVYFKGWGAFSTDDPEGTKFILPEGIEFLEAVPYTMGENDSCYRKDPMSERAIGNGELVSVCVSFYNKTDKPVKLTLPPGLVLISRDKKVQNGILVVPASYEIQPKTVDYHQFNLQCMNNDRSGSGHGTAWDLGPVTNVKPVQELFKFLETKKIDKDIMAGAVVQVAILAIGDQGYIDDFIWARLKQLPDK